MFVVSTYTCKLKRATHSGSNNLGRTFLKLLLWALRVFLVNKKGGMIFQ